MPKSKESDKSEIEEVHKVIPQLSRDKPIAIKLILDNSEDFEAMFYSIHSEANVDYLIAERIECGRNQMDTNLKIKEPHVNTSNASSQNYESINTGLDLTQKSAVTESLEEIHFSDLNECKIIDELDLRELEQIPHAVVRLVEGQVLEEFMLEEEICDMSLPKLSRAEESVHNDKIKLETPKINAIEINEIPREEKLEVSIPTRNILGDSIPKLHAKRRKVLGSKLGRRVNPTKLVKRKVHSMCSSPSKPPDRQNSLDENAKEKNVDNRPTKPLTY